MKKLVTLMLCSFISLSACGQTPDSTQTVNTQANKVEMPKDCQEYFDGLKALAKENQNLAEKFGYELANIDQAWQVLNEADRENFSKKCIIRNRQLKKMQGTPELEKLLNEL